MKDSSSHNNSSNNRENKDREKYAVIAVYAFIVIAAGFAAVMVISWGFDFLSEKRYSGILRVLTPIIYGVVIAYLLNPLLVFFEKKVFYKIKKKAGRILSLLSAYILSAIIITLLGLMVVPQVLSSMNQLTRMITDWFSPNAGIINSENRNNDDTIDITDNEHTDNISDASDSKNAEDITAANETNETEDNIYNIDDIIEIEENLFRNSKIVIALIDFADSLQEYVDKLGLELNIEATVNTMIPELTENLMNFGRNSITSVINVTFAMLSGLASGIWNIILGLLLSVYLLVGKDRFIAQIKKLLFALFPSNFSYRLIRIMRQTHEIFGGFITGKIVESLIVGMICFIIISILRIPYAMLISVIVAVTNVIPFFGSFLGAIISIFFLVIVDIKQALIFTVFILILQQFDGNFIGPKILGPKVGLPAFLVICAVLIMGGLYGFPGMVIGVPIFAIIYVLIKEYAENRLEKKGFPIKTEYYIKNIAGSENFDDVIGGDEDYKSNINKPKFMRKGFETAEKEKKESRDSTIIFSVLSKITKNIAGKFGKASNASDSASVNKNNINNKNSKNDRTGKSEDNDGEVKNNDYK